VRFSEKYLQNKVQYGALTLKVCVRARKTCY